jgi:hypothetical protein
MAEARLELAGIKINPSNITRESIPAGMPAKFKWTIAADKPGTYDGRVWLYIRYHPIDGGEAIQVPVYIANVIIQAKSLLGMNGAMSRLVGCLGIVLGILLVSNDMIRYAVMHKKKSPTVA